MREEVQLFVVVDWCQKRIVASTICCINDRGKYKNGRIATICCINDGNRIQKGEVTLI